MPTKLPAEFKGDVVTIDANSANGLAGQVDRYKGPRAQTRQRGPSRRRLQCREPDGCHCRRGKRAANRLADGPRAGWLSGNARSRAVQPPSRRPRPTRTQAFLLLPGEGRHPKHLCFQHHLGGTDGAILHPTMGHRALSHWVPGLSAPWQRLRIIAIRS
jgi:hypothetical protein